MRKLGALRPDQQRADEHRMPGELVIDAGLDAVFRIGAAVEILREQRLALGVGDEIVDTAAGISPACSRPFFSHQTVFSVCSSTTTNLSLGCGRCGRRFRRRTRRPGRAEPSPVAIACSIERRSGKFQWTAARSFKPNLSAPWALFRRPVSFTLASATRVRPYDLFDRMPAPGGDRRPTRRRRCDPISGIRICQDRAPSSRLTSDIIIAFLRCSAAMRRRPCTAKRTRTSAPQAWMPRAPLFGAGLAPVRPAVLRSSSAVDDALGKRQTQGRIAEREVEPVRIEPGEPPGPSFGAEQLGCVEPHRIGMVVVHMRDRARFGLDQILRAGVSVITSRGLQIGGAGKAAVEMRGSGLKPPERKIAKAGIKLGFRMPREKTPAQAGSPGSSRATGAKAPSTVSRGWASGSPLPVEASSSDARPSSSRLAVWVDSRETRISGEPSMSVATLTREANGWPVLRSRVASAPARVARNSALGDRFRIEVRRPGRFRAADSGIRPGNGGGFVRIRPFTGLLHALNDVAAIAPVPPCLVTLPPPHGVSKAYGAGLLMLAADSC